MITNIRIIMQKSSKKVMMTEKQLQRGARNSEIIEDYSKFSGAKTAIIEELARFYKLSPGTVRRIVNVHKKSE